MTNAAVVGVNQDGSDGEALNKLLVHTTCARLHRAFSIILVDEHGDVCIQRRSGKKLLWPLFWSNSVCSHPMVGESIETAVKRRINEELGCVATELTEIFSFRYSSTFGDIGSEKEYCHVWIGRIRSTDVQFDPEEIDAVAFMSVESLSTAISSMPGAFTPWFSIEWPAALTHIATMLTSK